MALLSSKLKNQPKKKYTSITKNFCLTIEANKIKIIILKYTKDNH